MRISDWSSDVCSSDLIDALLNADQSFDPLTAKRTFRLAMSANMTELLGVPLIKRLISHGSTISLQIVDLAADSLRRRSEEHTSELQSLMRISYAVFCLKKKNNIQTQTVYTHYILLIVCNNTIIETHLAIFQHV